MSRKQVLRSRESFQVTQQSNEHQQNIYRKTFSTLFALRVLPINKLYANHGAHNLVFADSFTQRQVPSPIMELAGFPLTFNSILDPSWVLLEFHRYLIPLCIHLEPSSLKIFSFRFSTSVARRNPHRHLPGVSHLLFSLGAYGKHGNEGKIRIILLF